MPYYPIEPQLILLKVEFKTKHYDMNDNFFPFFSFFFKKDFWGSYVNIFATVLKKKVYFKNVLFYCAVNCF